MACRCLSLLTYWSLPTAEATELFGTVKVEGYVPKARENPTMVLYKKRLWTYGGLLPNNPLEKIEHEIYNDLNCFDIDSQTWIKVAADGAPKPKLGPRAVLDFAGTMWVWGGGAVGEDDAPGLSFDLAVHSLNLNEIDLHPKDDKSSGAWQQVEVTGTAPPGRWHNSAVMNGTGMVIFGGSGKDSVFADVHYLDFERKMWSEVKCQGDVPSARMAHGAAITSSGEMWVYGGQDRDRKEFEDLYYLKLDRRTWVKVAPKGVSPGPMVTQVQVMDAAGRMWLAGGGSTAQGHNDKVFYIDTTILPREWKEVEELQGGAQRAEATAAIETSGRMWCYGGNSPVEGATFPEILSTMVWLDTNPPAPSTATTSAHPLDPAASGGIGVGVGTILVIVLVVAVIAAGTFFSLPCRRERRLLQEVQEPQQVELGPRA